MMKCTDNDLSTNVGGGEPMNCLDDAAFVFTMTEIEAFMASSSPDDLHSEQEKTMGDSATNIETMLRIADLPECEMVKCTNNVLCKNVYEADVEMLVLFETPAGFALFKVLDEGKLDKVEDLWKEFATSESARKIVKLKAFNKFENTSDALSAATLLIDSKPSKGLRKFLRTHCDGETLAVADSKLGNAIKEKLVS
ncbi:hypothetical protein B296_00022082 [Ensete ventricosum]|uniref:Nucleolar protein 58/56 N-terminal domain-containing protein n=1 Tax=Ensete ventricosum TaxID=4639 RepID=A0A426YXF5_ENSVE|nr:hypothetical protein B296_00022082 [Ensete ventricosum]